jgi:broad specificity phosphatase PhoE
VEGGESPNEMRAKHLEFIKHYRSMPYDKILICSHGRAMRILLSVMLNKPLLDMDQFHHKNTSVYKLTDDGKRISLLLHNSLEHLDVEV